MILSDNETKVDLLNNEAIAKTIVDLVRDRPELPVTIGVHGDWGAGKSSILEMIEVLAEEAPSTLCLKFNGWRFQGFEDAKIALIEGIVLGLTEKRPALKKATGALKNIYNRIDKLKVAKKLGGLALSVYTGIPSQDMLAGALRTAEALLDDPAELLSKDNVMKALDGIKGVMKSAVSKHVPEDVREFQKEFDELLKEASIDRLIVLVDDLDRCLPDTAIETLEAIRLFVFTKKTAFVVAADEAMIEYSVRKHFPDLPDSTGPRDYARNYLEKLIQVPFRIPALGEAETRLYVMLLLVGEAVGECSEFDALIGAARGYLQRPWKNDPLKEEVVIKTLGAQAERLQGELTLSEQIGPILASGTRGNPRQIKRFLNTLLLRHRTAIARGFGDDIRLPTLAKLMLAERFLPRTYDQIATAAASSADGLCENLRPLEESAAPKVEDAVKPGQKVKAQTKEQSTSADNVILAEWKASPEVLEWANIPPSLAAVDLRPYLFVAKDRKDYFGPVSALGKLVAVGEKLLAPKIVVQSSENDLRALTQHEAGKVFDWVKARIVSSDSFEKKPAGVDGLVVLVKAQPTLQNAFVSFLESLPADRVGAWAATGWEGAIVEASAVSRLATLGERWKSSGSDLLKTALRVSKSGVVR
ncbi:MAG: NTPase KAP [Acidobacteria bacterium]|nr:NTPase KAP [Acidobacteriota bacterium]